jgi:hypothetical protein
LRVRVPLPGQVNVADDDGWQPSKPVLQANLPKATGRECARGVFVCVGVELSVEWCSCVLCAIGASAACIHGTSNSISALCIPALAAAAAHCICQSHVKQQLTCLEFQLAPVG